MHRDIRISRQRGQFECGLAAWIAGDDGVVPVSRADQCEIDRCHDQESRTDLRQEALSDPTVQALFEIFPVERTKIEEM